VANALKTSKEGPGLDDVVRPTGRLLPGALVGGLVGGGRGWLAALPFTAAFADAVLTGNFGLRGWVAGGLAGGLLVGCVRPSWVRASGYAALGALVGGGTGLLFDAYRAWVWRTLLPTLTAW
jgi:hypothetical protein